MNLLIIGHRQHGKSDIGQRLAKALSTKAHDSSWYVAQNVIYPQLKDLYDYKSVKECYDDRDNHRAEWFEIIEQYNDEPDRLTRAILSEGSIYVGMRSRMEFEGSKHHFDAVVWVDASERAPLESPRSMKLTAQDSDYVLDNNGPIEDLPVQIGNLLLWLANRVPLDEEPIRVYGMDVAHHIGRGTMSQYVLEQLIMGNQEEVEKQLGELYGPGSTRPITPMRVLDNFHKNSK